MSLVPCPHCKQSVSPRADHCPACGLGLGGLEPGRGSGGEWSWDEGVDTSEAGPCADCGRELPGRARFCPGCGLAVAGYRKGSPASEEQLARLDELGASPILMRGLDFRGAEELIAKLIKCNHCIELEKRAQAIAENRAAKGTKLGPRQMGAIAGGLVLAFCIGLLL